MTRPAPENERFLSRWSRLKRAQAADAEAPAAERPDAAPPAVPSPVASPGVTTSASSASFSTSATVAPAAPVAPALPAIDTLTMDSDYGQFFQPKVPEALKRAAVKKLFTDPHFNIMDGLDTYIDDYSKPDPIPPEMLARLVQARDIIDHPSDRKPEAVEAAPVVAEVEGVEGQAGAEETEVIASEVVDGEAAPETAKPVTAPVTEPVGWVERSDTHLPIPEEPVGTKPG
ncbi:MAG: DUF3306 domain-containing protein [Betaproteobacteria bacterium]|nr:DUF3306 domain-containing protein [Betaproteobacteria bacterium]